MNYNDIIISMLLLSNFFENNNEEAKQAKFIFLEPLIIKLFFDKKQVKIKDIEIYFEKFNFDNHLLRNLLGFYQNKKIIYKPKKRDYYILKNINDTYINKIIEMFNSKKLEWDRVKINIEDIIYKLNLKHINNQNLEKYIFDFFYYVFNSKEKNNISFLQEIDLEISIVLEEIYKNNHNEYNIIQNLLCGIAIITAIKTNYKGYNIKNIPVLYLDNVFLGHLLGWCDKITYRNCQSMLKQLQDIGFHVKIHKETFDVIILAITRYLKKKIMILSQKHFFIILNIL